MGGKGAKKKRIKGGRFGPRVIVEESIIENAEVVAPTIVPHVVVSSILQIPRIGLDKRSKAKIARAESDYVAERQRSVALMKRIKNLETGVVASNHKIVDVEERLKVTRELNYQRLRLARRAASFAKSSEARKVAEVAQRIRGKAANNLQIARKKHRDEVSRRQRDHEDACRAAVQDENNRLEEQKSTHEAAIHDKLPTHVDNVHKLRDAEILMLQKQHEAENEKLQKTLDKMLQKSKTSCSAKRQKIHDGLPKCNPPPN